MSNQPETASEAVNYLGELITRLSETIDAGSTLAHDTPAVRKKVLKVFNELAATIQKTEATLETDLMDIEFCAEMEREDENRSRREAERQKEAESKANRAGYQEQEVFKFLDSVRESGAINMFGAGQFISEMFDTDQQESKRLLLAWMKQFQRAEK